MNYRTLGRTGIEVSEIGLGSEGYIGRSGESVLQAHLCPGWIDGQYKCTRDLEITKNDCIGCLRRQSKTIKEESA